MHQPELFPGHHFEGKKPRGENKRQKNPPGQRKFYRCSGVGNKGRTLRKGKIDAGRSSPAAAGVGTQRPGARDSDTAGLFRVLIGAIRDSLDLDLDLDLGRGGP